MHVSPETIELLKEIVEEFISEAGGYLEYDLKRLDVEPFKKALKELEEL